MKKKVLIICFSDFCSEPRVLRTIKALVAEFDIHVFSIGKNMLEKVAFTNLSEHLAEDKLPLFHMNWPALIRKPVSLYTKMVLEKKFSDKTYFKKKYWTKGKKKILEMINDQDPDVIIGHSIYTLPLMAESNPSSKKIFNAHEYYLKEFEENTEWVKNTKPYYEYLLDNYFSKINEMFCVCKTIQEDYQKHYKINSVVVNNARDFIELDPKELKKDETIKLIHHGAALRGRKLELIIEVADLLPENYELTLMLTKADATYLEELKQSTKNKKVKFVEPVEMDKIPVFLNKFDIGVYILPPTNYNNAAALPNKFFDFIQARLCLAISPNVEMKNIVEKYELGVIADDFTPKQMADKIASLSVDDINKYKNNSDKHAKALSGEANQKLMLEEVKKLVLN